MSLESVRQEFRQVLASVGRAALHAQYPDDFEYYAVSFELVNFEGETVDMLIFPILPSSISDSTQTVTNVKKAASSVVSLYNPSFNPFNIQLSGDFGRNFKILVGQQQIQVVAVNLKSKNYGEFNAQVKTGYGVMKILQRIIELSISNDANGRPYKLFFNNQAFNSNHLVEVNNYSFQQSEQKNMIWSYSIAMTAIAPALAVQSAEERKTSLKKLLTFDNATKAANTLAGIGLQEIQKNKQKLLKQ